MPLSQDEKSEFKKLYIQTARDYVKELQNNTSVLIAAPEKVDALESVHRAAHSLNSQTTMMAYVQMGSVTAPLENLFRQTKESKTPLTKEVLTSILDTVQNMSKDLDAIENTDQEIDLSQDASKLQALVLT